MKLNIEEIKNLIPHRDPFLFVDTCEIITPGEHGTSEKLFTANEYFFKGHFPDKPIVPGVIIVEAMKTMNHVPSTSDGEVKKILVEDGQPVEFGQTLVILK